MASPDLHEQVAAKLREGEQRYTSGRRRVVRVLLDAGAPLTIPQILEADPALAQSSVYRNLAILEEAGAVSRVVTTDEFARFELAEDLSGDHHHHLMCSLCGDVSDFALDAGAEATLDQALRSVARRAGYEVDHHRLDLVGLCPSCR